MKKIFALILFIGFLYSCQTRKTIFVENSDKVEVQLCSSSTKNELQKIQQTLVEKHQLKFNFDKTVFNSSGGIDYLDFTIEGPEGFKGHVEADLYINDVYHGFIRNYKSDPPFRCGQLEE